MNHNSDPLYFYFTKRALGIRSNYTCFLQLADWPQAYCTLIMMNYCYTAMQLQRVDCIRRGSHEWATHPPLGLEDYNPAAKPRDNQNFLSLGVLCSIEKSFKFCQSLPVAIDSSTELSQLTNNCSHWTTQWCLPFGCWGLAGEKTPTISKCECLIRLVFKRANEKEQTIIIKAQFDQNLMNNIKISSSTCLQHN